MTKAKIFRSGNSQAVRLPKEFQFRDKEVYIKKVGRTVVLIPKEAPWELLERSLGEFTDDFLEGSRVQPRHEIREDW